MKRLLLPILFILNFLCLKAQEVKFISVNQSIDSLENITFKKLPRLLEKDTLRPDTFLQPAKWMVKLQKKLAKEQRQDSNIYIFFCHNPQDSVTAFLPLSGKYGYVLFDTAKVGVVELERVQKRLCMHKYQWDNIHNPESMIGLFQGEEEGDYTTVGLTALSELQNFNKTYSFITPAGKIITLPERTSKVVFCTYDRYFKKEGEISTPKNFSSPIGCLVGFVLDGKTYSARANIESNLFIGYAYGDGKDEDDYYKDEISYNLKPVKGISLITTVENKQFVGYAGMFSPSDTEIKENNKGSGNLQKSLFINNIETSDLIKPVKDFMSSSTDKAVRITDVHYLTQKAFSTINTTPPQKADDFLKSVLNEYSPLADVLVYFGLVYTTPEAIAAIKGCNQENALDLHMMLIAEFNKNLNTYLSGGGIADETTMNRLAEEFLAVSYRSFNEIEGANALKDIVTNAKTIDEVKAGLEQYNSACIFSALELDTRTKILDWLFMSDDGYWTVNDKNIVYELLENAPASHITELLKSFAKDNYKWLYTLWDEGSEKYSKKVIDLISELVKSNFKSLDIPITTKQVYMFDLGTFKDVPVAQSPFCIGMKEGSPVSVDNYHTIERGPYDDAPSIEFKEDGRIHFSQEYTLRDNTVIIQAVGARDIQRKFDEDIDYPLLPFEPVTIYFGRNYDTLGINSGEPYVVPAIWALRMADATSDEEFIENLRTAGNITALVLAPFTGGSTSSFVVFMGRLGAAVAAADILVQNEKKTLKAEDLDANKDFYEAWDKFYVAVAVAEGTTALANIARTITVPRTFSELNSLVTAKWGKLSVTMQDAWTGLKALRGASATGDAVAEAYKGVTFEYFKASVKEFAANEDLAKEAFELYKQEKWSDLEAFFKKNKLNSQIMPDGSTVYWPPANGGYDMTSVPLTKGMKFDRYQKFVNKDEIIDGIPEFTGTYTSPIKNDVVFDFGSRALEGSEDSYDLYYKIEILKDLPFEGEQAKVIPWHGYKGNGLQIQFKFPTDKSWSWQRLIDEKYVNITPIKSPTGNFEILVNGKIKPKL